MPNNEKIARKIRETAAGYVLIDNELYITMLFVKICVNTEERKYLLWEIHESICGSYIGTKVLVNKALWYGYYWATMKEDSANSVKTCTKCQVHANEHHIPMSEYHTLGTLIPFAQWGIYLLGLFLRHLLERIT